MRIARARGSKGDGTFLFRGVFQPLPGTGHTSTLDLIKLLLSVFDLRSSPFEDSPLRHHASFKIMP
jgi:hypothetical protein